MQSDAVELDIIKKRRERFVVITSSLTPNGSIPMSRIFMVYKIQKFFGLTYNNINPDEIQRGYAYFDKSEVKYTTYLDLDREEMKGRRIITFDDMCNFMEIIKTDEENVEDTENKENKENKMQGLTPKEIQITNSLARKYFTTIDSGSKKEKLEIEEIIKTFFQKYFVNYEDEDAIFDGNLRHLEKNEPFTGNIKFSSLAQKWRIHNMDIINMLQYIAEIKHGRYRHSDHSWVLPECQNLFLEYIKNGISKTQIYKSGTKKIKFNAKKRKVSIKFRKGEKFTYFFDIEELLNTK